MTGGTFAHYSAAGVTTVLVTATGGEEGEIVVPELATPENFARLRELRDAELAAAVQVLGIHHLERLGYRDSGMVDTPANSHPESLHMADREAATRRVVALVRQYQPHVLISYDEQGGYGHPDHIACHQITVAAFAAAGDPQQYPGTGAAWEPSKLYYATLPRNQIYQTWQQMRERGMETPLDNPEFDLSRFTQPDERMTTCIDVRAYLPQKWASLDCHVTQIKKDSPFMIIPDDLAQNLFGYEYFILAQTRVALPPRADGQLYEDDLFVGINEQ
ncbi:MAG: hypothetical protein HC911_06855 [Chloroflexaceae bacterium]|nr:hypothetical protein [Chloroflexaceae bacterium]